MYDLPEEFFYSSRKQAPATPAAPVTTPVPILTPTTGSYIPGEATGKYIQTPQAQAALGLLWPGIQQYGTALSGQGTLYSVPQAPMPTQGWFSGLDPSITSGLWEPYTQASRQLAEQMGASGMAGSARGGWSGAASAGLGKFWEQAGRDVGLSAWNMINPNQMAQYQAQLTAQQMPWAAFPSMFGSAMPTPYIKQGTSGGGKK